ncbi:MAG: DGQHR domain-containing protein [Candidatus Bathyarchaeota archaeon]
MRIDAFKLSQNGSRGVADIYITVFRAGDLVQKCKIDRRTPSNTSGYQRLPSERRLSMIRGSAVRYLVRELGYFPTSILLNVRGEVSFSENKRQDWFSYGTLDTKIDDFWIIDGQHRIEALKRAIARNRDFENYPVITSILRLPDRFDEMLLFYIVNRRQKGVKTDLVHRHLQRMLQQKGEDWLLDLEGKRGLTQGYAIEIVDILNKDPVSPWYGRIREVGEARHMDHVIKDSDMMPTITEILNEHYFKNMPIKEIANLLIEYWNALYNIYPECFTDPDEFSLLHSPGMPAFHKLFIDVYGIAIQSGQVSEESMYNVLLRLLAETPEHPAPEFRVAIEPDFWGIQSGPIYGVSTSHQNIQDLYDNLQEKIWMAGR